MAHQARKRFGQNFLQDAGVIGEIMAAVQPARGERFIEIGPGLAAITRPLLTALGQLDAIEIDRDLAARLREELPGLTLHVGDVLEFDFSSLGADLRVVGNLPYNISTPLLFHLAGFAEQIRDIHVMLQKEIVLRMIAEPGDSNFSRLSVMIQYRFVVDSLIEVPPAAFNPAPKVDSAVVRLIPQRPLPHAAIDEKLFARVVTTAFSQRRKTLRNSLSTVLTPADFAELDIAPTARAQELSVAQFVAIANRITQSGAAARTSPSE